MNKENKNSILDPDMLTEAIKEQTRDTISSLLGKELRNYLKESIEDDDEDDKAPATDSKEDETPETETPEVAAEVPAEDEGEDAPEGDGDATNGSEDNPVVDEPEEGDTEWSDFKDYEVGDGEYDLTGEEDIAKIAKVWKALSDSDDVVVTQQDGKIDLKDKATGAEYLIDPNAGESEEGKGKENASDDAEPIFEITLNEDGLGYTDNYQGKNPVEGGEPYDAPTPNKTRNWDAGLTNGKNKPWAGDSEHKGQPYKSNSVNEEENLYEISLGTDECGDFEPSLEEGASFGDENSMRLNPGNEVHDEPHRRRHNDKNGEMSDGTAMNEAFKKRLGVLEEENKVLKSSLVKFRKALNESVIANANIGKFVKLVIENATTTEEKHRILERFSKEAKTLEQSQALYESIDKELKSAKKTGVNIDKQMSINEATAVNKINENKIYKNEDNSINESLDLMRRMNIL